MAKTVSFGGTDWDADQQAIDQRRKLAIALMQQSAMAQPTETAGGIAVRQSPLSGLARMLTGVVGKQDLDAADSEQRDLQSRKSAMLADWLERMPKATTEQQLQGDRPGAGSFENVTKQPGLNDYMQWASQGALMGPQAGQIGQTGLSLAMNQQQRADQREFQSAQAEEARKQRTAELLMKIEDARVGREEKLAAQKELMQMQLEGRRQMGQLAASLRQPPAPSPVTIVDPNDPNKSVVIDAKTNRVIGQAPKGPAGEKPMTEFQGKSMLYGTRAAESHKILNRLEETISKEGLAVKQSLQNAPLVGGMLGAAGNALLSDDQQKVEQAQRNFVNAVLRQESGAVISQQEFDNAKKQYFPQPGDSKQVIEQKRKNRETAIHGFERMAGPGGGDVREVMGSSAGIPDQSAIDAELKRRGL